MEYDLSLWCMNHQKNKGPKRGSTPMAPNVPDREWSHVTITKEPRLLCGER